jgi:hypothetical protein
MLYKIIYNKIPNYKKIDILKNKEKGACYIFGDGISLKYYNLLSFSNLPSLSLGNLSIHNQSKFLNLKYSIICDPLVFLPGKCFLDYLKRFILQIKEKNISSALKLIFPIKKLYQASLFSPKKILFTDNEVILNSKFIAHCSNYYATKFLNKSYYYKYDLRINEKIHKFLDKFSFNVYASSLRFSIYFAIFLGFKKIYLVGCDYLDIEPKSGHWYEIGRAKPYLGKQDSEYIKLMRNFIDIKIITLHKSDGKNYISYKDFSGNNLEYKENNEIVSKEKLDLLKMYDYKIDNK